MKKIIIIKATLTGIIGPSTPLVQKMKEARIEKDRDQENDPDLERRDRGPVTERSDPDHVIERNVQDHVIVRSDHVHVIENEDHVQRKRLNLDDLEN